MKQLNSNITGIVREIVSGGITGIAFDPGSSGMKDAFETITKGVANLTELGLAGWLTFAAISPALALTPVGWAAAAAIVVDKVLGVGIVNKAIGWLSSGIFGGDVTPGGSGISIQKGGAEVYPYQRWTESGGWFSGDKARYSQGPMNEELTNLFSGPNGVFTTLREMMIGLAEGLGGDVAFASKSPADLFGNFEIDLAGLDAEGVNKKLNEEISRISDNYAKAVFRDLINIYQGVGEGAFETVTRLTVDLLSITDILEKTGKTITPIIPDAIALSESLIKIAGGLEELQGAADAYYDKFFSDSEKQLRRQTILTESLTQMSLPLPLLRDSYRDLVELQDLSTEAGKENYVTLLKLSSTADEYYSVLEDVADAQDDVTQSLRDQRDTIAQWLSDMNRSPLAPSNSMEAIQVEYNRLKGIASGEGATSTDTSNFLNYAKEYLEYMRNYGGDYQEIYSGVMGDVEGLKSGIDMQIYLAQAQLQAIKDADDAARLIAAATLAQLQAQMAADAASKSLADQVAADQAADQAAAAAASAALIADPMPTSPAWEDKEMNMWFPPNNVYPVGWDWNMNYHQWEKKPGYMAEGGYADKPSIFGEAGGEWAVPTYEPQRKNFLKKAPQAFWDNLGLNGGGGEVHIHIHNETDGREMSEVIAKYIPRNGNLSEAIRRVK